MSVDRRDMDGQATERVIVDSTFRGEFVLLAADQLCNRRSLHSLPTGRMFVGLQSRVPLPFALHL